MALSTNYQCPACTGPLHFSAKSNKLECDYCGSVYEISQIDAAYEEKIKKSAEKGMDPSADQKAQMEDSGTDSYKVYTCSSCGAELFCDAVTVATSCPYCGNPNVIAGKFHGGVMPDYVIPFKFDKKDAIHRLSDFYKGKRLLPKVFSSENHIEEVKGIYVPFWLYSGNADVQLSASAERIQVHTTSKERVERISHYKVEREGNITYERVPVDASVKMDNDMMDSLEPFNYEDLKPFTSSYLPGFLAENYDDKAENCKERLEKRVNASAVRAMLNDIVGYDSVTTDSSSVQLNEKGKPEYAFFPVWLLSTKWKDQNYLFAMNGQTGKMVGKLPVDKGKFFRILFFIALGGTVILTPILYFIIMRFF